MLYTLMPMEAVFPDDYHYPPQITARVQGRLCLLRSGEDARLRLERLISTDPQDYLEPKFSPDSLVQTEL